MNAARGMKDAFANAMRGGSVKSEESRLMVINTKTGSMTTIKIIDKSDAAMFMAKSVIGEVHVLPHRGECCSSMTWYEFLLGYFFDFIADDALKRDFDFSARFTEELTRLEAKRFSDNERGLGI